ncbi:iron-siderophore ABC transporter substrate-binding protein [Streptosporangium sp. NPDC051022]|uniref:iron-siderophore ABC transporter substrate-binding protein n=1 Tax=Streptosporangium sp. NPDC051022 TaxID=3155752 RepID=UPI00341A9F58
MSQRPFTLTPMDRRRFLGAGAAVGAGLLLTACGAATDAATPAAATGSAAPVADAGGFPRTIATKLGQITIPKRPERVVTVGFPTGTADAALACGVVPVGMPKAAGHPGEIEPWVAAKLQGRTPTLLEANTVDVEQILALKPDLILAGMHRGIPDDFAKLSPIAPVISYEGEAPFQDTWQQQTTLIGRALGAEDKAAAAIKEVEDRFAKIRADHPGWQGKTFTFTQGATLAQIPTVTDPNEASARMFSSFGFELSPKVRELGAKREVSAERLDLIDADLVIVFFPSPDAQKTFEGNAVFSKIPAVKEGRYVTVDGSLAFPLIAPGVLNTSWAIDQILPKIEKAMA